MPQFIELKALQYVDNQKKDETKVIPMTLNLDQVASIESVSHVLGVKGNCTMFIMLDGRKFVHDASYESTITDLEDMAPVYELQGRKGDKDEE